MVRDEHGQTPPVVQQFLVDLLTYNDNLGNKVSSRDDQSRGNEG
jgi:transcription initiation factor TFIID subunit 2